MGSVAPTLALILYGLAGLLVGILINRLADAYPEWGRVGRYPHCPYCDSPYPRWAWSGTLAYLVLQTRCVFCGAPISWRRPLVELATAVLFGAVWVRNGPGPLLAAHSAYAVVLVLVAVIDLEHHRIPTEILYPAGVLAMGAGVLHPSPGFWRLSLVGGAVGGAIMGLVYLGSIGFEGVVKRWTTAGKPSGLLGVGDVRLGVLIGVMVGSRLVGSALLVGLGLAGLAALGYVVVEGMVRRRYRPFSSLALGPYLAVGALGVMLGGQPATAWFS